MKGEYANALRQFAEEPIWQAVTLARAGRVDATSGLPLANGDVYLALYWAALGRNDKAFELLDSAYRAHALALTILANPVWDPLRSDVRFQALLSRMGLAGRS